jgi:hypothetical protein
MTAFSIGGQSSGDFRETSGRVQLLHVVTRNSVGILTADAFTQANPPVVTDPATVSTTLAGITKTGVLGGSIAFTRPDGGNNHHGGPIKVGQAYTAGYLPLGIYINDSLGSAFENTPGVASGRGPYVCGSGSCVGVSIYETKNLLGAGNLNPGDPLIYAVGDKLWASANGYITKEITDAYEYNVAAQNAIEFVTLIGVVKCAPDSTSSLLVLDMRV